MSFAQPALCGASQSARRCAPLRNIAVANLRRPLAHRGRYRVGPRPKPMAIPQAQDTSEATPARCPTQPSRFHHANTYAHKRDDDELCCKAQAVVFSPPLHLHRLEFAPTWSFGGSQAGRDTSGTCAAQEKDFARVRMRARLLDSTLPRLRARPLTVSLQRQLEAAGQTGKPTQGGWRAPKRQRNRGGKPDAVHVGSG